MPSWMKFVGLWGLAAVAALTLSWVAVSQVRDRVIQPVAVIPTTIVAIETTDPTVVVIEPISDDQSVPDLSTTSTSSTEPSAASQSTTSTTRPRSASPSTTSTTATPQTTATTAPTTTTNPPPQTTTTAPSANTSSHSTPGGSVTISTSPGVVSFVSAIPQAGFTTELRDTGPDRVRVRFVGATTIFEFEARWDEGELDIETSEHTP